MKKHFLIIISMLACLLVACSMGGGETDNMNPPSVGQPKNPSAPETPEEPEQPLSRPYISFIDFISPSLSSTAIIMTTQEQNAEIWYTTDGTTPSEDNGSEYYRNKRQVICGSTVITAVPDAAGCTIKAVTFKDRRYF